MPRTNGTWTQGNGPPTRFKPGTSGNPGGKARTLVDMQELARTYTPAAIKALGDALNSPRERVAAAAVLLDRAWGKPLQSVAVSGDTDAIGLHLLAARAAQLLEGTGPPAPPTLEGHADSEPGPGPNLLDAPKPVE